MTRNNRSRRQSLSVQRLEDRTVLSSVQGTVFTDANNNGVFDPGEAGVPGWTVFVDNNRDTILNPGEVTTVTDANGDYFIDTTAIPPNSNGWDYFSLDLQVGSGGRWLNTTAGTVYAHPINEPTATGRDFGVRFEPYVSVQPDGPESLVNMTTPGTQESGTLSTYPQPVQVASDTAGNYVVAWRGPGAAGATTDYARVFNTDGTPRTGEITVASGTDVRSPQLAMADNGRFVVAWPSYQASSGSYSSMARIYNANGTPATSTITVAAGTRSVSNYFSGVAIDSVGNFAVLYESRKISGSGGGAKTLDVQRLTLAGALNGKAIDVSTVHLQNGEASIAMDASGRFVVVWDEAAPNIVLAQRYSASGQLVGSQTTVATVPFPNVVWQSSVSMNGSGRFAVTWIERAGGGQLKAQVYDWGTPVGGPLTLDTLGTPGMTTEELASSDVEADGDVTFAWAKGGEVEFRRLTASGVLENALVANTTTQGAQTTPGVAATGNDRFVVSWQGYGPGDDAGVFMQRFKPLGMSPVGNPNLKDGGEKSLAIWVGGNHSTETSGPQLVSHPDRAQADLIPIASRDDAVIPVPRANDDNPWFTFDSRDWLANVTDEGLVNDSTFVGL